jgi:hypothetical protein
MKKKKPSQELMMQAFDYFISEGYLVPVLNESGQPERRKNGDIVYELTTNPVLLAKWKKGAF